MITFTDVARAAGVKELPPNNRADLSKNKKDFCKTCIDNPGRLSSRYFFDTINFCLEHPDRFQRCIDCLSKEQKILLKLEAWNFCQQFPHRQPTISRFIRRITI